MAWLLGGGAGLLLCWLPTLASCWVRCISSPTLKGRVFNSTHEQKLSKSLGGYELLLELGNVVKIGIFPFILVFLDYFFFKLIEKPVCRSESNRTGHRTTDQFQIGKWVHQGCILSPCLFNLYAEYIMRNSVLEEAQAGIKIAGRNINNIRYADGTTLMAESEEELKSL